MNPSRMGHLCRFRTGRRRSIVWHLSCHRRLPVPAWHPTLLSLFAMSSITIQIPDFLRQQVERLTAEAGFSVDQFFVTAASEKIAVIEEGGYIQRRAARADDDAFLEAISHIPATPVSETWDRLD